MCVRYVIPGQEVVERELAPHHRWWRFGPSFNVAPSRHVPAVRLYQKETEGVMLRWGLIAPWAKADPAQCDRPCASGEDFGRAELLRDAWLNGQRCLLPLTGFYTWQLMPAGYRQPHFVHGSERSVLAMAGVWERSASDEEDVIESCAIIMVPAIPLVARIGNTMSRMPALLAPQEFETWLRGTPGQAQRLLESLPDVSLHFHRVSPRVNSLGQDDQRLIEAVH